MSDAALLDSFRAFDTGIVSDALDSLGVPGVVVTPRRLTGGGSVVGFAVTVQLAPHDGTPSTRHLCAAAIEDGAEQSVIVVAGGLEHCGGWGGLLSRAASHKGIRGVVVDGASRDVDEAAELGFSVFARGGAPSTARGRQREIASQVPVVIDGIGIAPGDIVVADGTGVVIVPRGRADDVLVAARLIADREREMVARLDAGHPVGSVLDGSYESMLTTQEGQR